MLSVVDRESIPSLLSLFNIRPFGELDYLLGRREELQVVLTAAPSIFSEVSCRRRVTVSAPWSSLGLDLYPESRHLFGPSVRFVINRQGRAIFDLEPISKLETHIEPSRSLLLAAISPPLGSQGALARLDISAPLEATAIQEMLYPLVLPLDELQRLAEKLQQSPASEDFAELVDTLRILKCLAETARALGYEVSIPEKYTLVEEGDILIHLPATVKDDIASRLVEKLKRSFKVPIIVKTWYSPYLGEHGLVIVPRSKPARVFAGVVLGKLLQNIKYGVSPTFSILMSSKPLEAAWNSLTKELRAIDLSNIDDLGDFIKILSSLVTEVTEPLNLTYLSEESHSDLSREDREFLRGVKKLEKELSK